MGNAAVSTFPSTCTALPSSSASGGAQEDSHGEVRSTRNWPGPSSPRPCASAGPTNPVPILVPCHRVIGSNVPCRIRRRVVHQGISAELEGALPQHPSKDEQGCCRPPAFWADPRRVSGHRRSAQPVAGGIAEMGGGVSPVGQMDWIGSNGPSLSGCMPVFSAGRAPWHVRSPRERRMFGKGAVICIWWNGSAANTTN